MFETLISKLHQPDVSFLAVYVSILVVIAYIGLMGQYIMNRKLKAENNRLKQQQQGSQTPKNTRLDLTKSI